MKTTTFSICATALVLLLGVGANGAHTRDRTHTSTIFGGSQVERGSGNMTTEQRDVGSFDNVESNIGADISVAIGKPQSVSVTFDDNIIQYVTTVVKRGTLIVESSHSFSTHSQCQIKIVVPQLEGVSVGGSGAIEVLGLDAEKFAVEINGSAGVTVSGKTGELAIEVNGSGDVDTRDLAAGDVSVEINGSGNVNLLARDYLKASINGSGDITYAGDPAHVVKSVEGSGRIRRR